MTTPKAKFAGLALIAALCGGFTLGLTAPGWAGMDEAAAALQRGDYATALREWHPLAKQGHAEAQYNLGIMYSYGQNVRQDYAEAVTWYRKAAKQGHAEAQYNLGLMYRKGHGVPQDWVRAYAWYDVAASSYSPGNGFDRAVKYRDLVAAEMTPAQIVEAENLVREWMERHGK